MRPCLGIALLLVAGRATIARADIVQTTDPATAATFMAGASIERFDDLPDHPLSAYVSETLTPAAAFNSRDPFTQPTFNSGGGMPTKPELNNPGSPIAILSPTGAIVDDVASPAQVAGPTETVDPTQTFNSGFIEIFFVEPVARVGFWLTHGGVLVIALDENGEGVPDNNSAATVAKGEFIGIDAGFAAIKSVTIVPLMGVQAFTIDDVVWSDESLIEPPNHQRLAFSNAKYSLDAAGVDLLGQPGAIALSANGRSLYALEQSGDSLLVFDRDPNTGALAFVESHTHGQGGVDGLRFGLNLAVSADGKNVYVVSAENKLSTFARDPSDGTLSFLEVLVEGQSGVSGINTPFDFEISPDGDHLYVLGHVSRAVTTFARDAQTGLLQFQSSTTEGIVDANSYPEQMCASADGKNLYVGSFQSLLTVYLRDEQSGDLSLFEVQPLATASSDCVVSADGQSVYVPGATSGTVQLLDRDSATGAVTPSAESEDSGLFVSRLYASPSGANVYAHDASNQFASFERDLETGALHLLERHQDGMNGVDGIGGGFSSGRSMASSEDGRHVYVAGTFDGAIAHFSTPRFDSAGFVEEGEDGIVDALGEPADLEISPDGQFAYVAARGSHAVSVFAIDSLNANLTFIEAKRRGEVEPANSQVILGLEGANRIAISADGASLYVSGETDGSITWFDRHVDGTLTYRATVFDAMLVGTSGLAASADGQNVYANAGAFGRWIEYVRDPSGSLTQLPIQPPLSGASALRGMVLTPDDDYVMMNGANLLLSFATAFARESSVDLTPLNAGISCDAYGRFIETSLDGTNLYSTKLSGSDSLVSCGWDAGSETLAGGVQIYGPPLGAALGIDGASGVAVSADDRLIAVAGTDADGFSLFTRDAISGDPYLLQNELEAIDPIRLGTTQSRDAAFTPDGRMLLVTGGGIDDGTIAMFVPVPEPGLGASVAAGGLLILCAGMRFRGSKRKHQPGSSNHSRARIRKNERSDAKRPSPGVDSIPRPHSRASIKRSVDNPKIAPSSQRSVELW